MRKRTVKTLKVIAVALVVLALVYSLAVGVSAARLRGAYAALRADGRPMELSDIMPPEIEETENAALLYESAALLLKAQPVGEMGLLKHLGKLSDNLSDKTITPDELVELKDLMGQEVVVRALWIVEQATQRRSCRFDFDYELGIDIPLAHLGDLRQFAFILGAKARIEAESGHADRAWETALVQLRLADALQTEPVLVSQVVRLAIARLSCGTIRELCEIQLPNAQQSSQIEDSFKSFEDIGPLVRATDGERLLFGEWAFSLPRSELLKQHELVRQGDWSDDVLGVLGVCFKPVFLSYHAAYLQIMHDAAGMLEGTISAEQFKTRERGARGLALSLTPAMARVKVILQRTQAEIRITRTGLALLRDKQTRGEFPQTLAGFEQADVQDPFSGALLIYRVSTDGFILYSIGADGKDNGGYPKQDKQERDWDIVWQFPSPRKTSPLPHSTTKPSLPGELRLGGEHIERLVLECEDGPDKTFEQPGESIMLPAGRYRLREVILEGGFRRERDSIYPEWDDSTSIVVIAGRPIQLNIGGPVRHLLTAEKDSGYLRMEYRFVGIGGGRYFSAEPGEPPAFTVYRDDKPVTSGEFESTGGSTYRYSWRVPLTVWGHLTIVPTADIGVHGPADGAATLFHWKWYYGPVRFTMWLLVGLAIVLVKANRNARALVILAPLLAVIVLWVLARAALPPDSGSRMGFNLLVFSVTAGLTLLWLLAHKLGSCKPLITLLLALAIMAGVNTIGIISHDMHDLQFGGDAEVAIIMLSLFELGMLFGFIRAARACRRSCSLRRFMTRLGFWILLCSVGLMFVFWLFGFLLQRGHDLGDLPECLFGGGFLGLLIFMVNIPFIVLAFHNSFFGERFRSCLRLKSIHTVA
ncbi:MAG: hypothetical protein ACYSW8_19915 [Planctomycetota bacterium]|jgi:hypothetical protein